MLWAGLFAGIGRLLIGYFAVRVLAALAVSFVTYHGFQIVTDTLLAAVSDQWGYLPPRMAAVASMLGIDTAITIVLSAWVAVIAIRSTAGSITKVVFGS